MVEKQADYYKANRQEVIARQNEYYQKNKTKITEKKRQWYQEKRGFVSNKRVVHPSLVDSISLDDPTKEGCGKVKIKHLKTIIQKFNNDTNKKWKVVYVSIVLFQTDKFFVFPKLERTWVSGRRDNDYQL